LSESDGRFGSFLSTLSSAWADDETLVVSNRAAAHSEVIAEERDTSAMLQPEVAKSKGAIMIR